MTRLGALLAAGAALAPAAAAACYLELGGVAGMTTADPLSVPVLVAARAAAEDGRTVRLAGPGDHRLARAVMMLGRVPARLDGQRIAGAPLRFAVLQAQSGYWTRYDVSGGTVRAEAHLEGPGEVDAVIVVADAALLAVLLEGERVGDLRADGLLRARGEAAEAAVATFARLLDRFASGGRTRPAAARPPSPEVR